MMLDTIMLSRAEQGLARATGKAPSCGSRAGCWTHAPAPREAPRPSPCACARGWRRPPLVAEQYADVLHRMLVFTALDNGAEAEVRSQE